MNETGRQAANETITVAIPTRGRGTLITETLRSIAEGDRTPNELLIVDQGDGPETHDAVRAWAARVRIPVRYLPTETRGVSRARNVALRAACGSLVAFTDDDVAVQSDWLSLIASEFAGCADLLQLWGSVMPPPNHDPLTEMLPYTILRARRPVALRDADVLSVMGANVSVRREPALQVIGLFDEELGAGATIPACDDSEYCLRALAVGARVHFSDAARVVHHAGARTGQERLRYRAHIARGEGIFWRRAWAKDATHGAAYRAAWARRNRAQLRYFWSELRAGKPPRGVKAWAQMWRAFLFEPAPAPQRNWLP